MMNEADALNAAILRTLREELVRSIRAPKPESFRMSVMANVFRSNISRLEERAEELEERVAKLEGRVTTMTNRRKKRGKKC